MMMMMLITVIKKNSHINVRTHAGSIIQCDWFNQRWQPVDIGLSVTVHEHQNITRCSSSTS
jgi:hypothetical protein